MRPYNVSEVNKYINKVISTDVLLSDISVEGEISNFTHHYSGHMYFDLKDEGSRIRCVMFKGYNQYLDIEMKDGLNVIIRGEISVYERNGAYQLYAKKVEETGLGDLYKKFEKLKKDLEKEGLFSEEYKKPLPVLPKKIGVVTSATGAAIRDIITVLKRRFPPVNILLYPALVQGENAPKEIIEGLKYLDSREDIDLIIFGRGGGAMEELFAFNDEGLARTIFGLETPCISAVGHEIDFTISDFVADKRAATPSAAAELAVPDIRVYEEELGALMKAAEATIGNKLFNMKSEKDRLKREIEFNSPERKLKDHKLGLDRNLDRLMLAIAKTIDFRKNEMIKIKSALDLSDPLIGLHKGFGLITDKKGKLVRSIDELTLNERVDIRLIDGKAEVLVEEICKED